MSLTEAAEVLPDATALIAVRLADEGVPIRAIARATKISSEDVRDAINLAISEGKLLQMPRDDWPPNQGREHRTVEQARLGEISDEMQQLYTMRLFGLTQLEAAFFRGLLRRHEMTREALHQIIEDRRADNANPTEQKMVDVIVCKLRKKLNPQGFTIKTLWACGYYLPKEQRRHGVDMLTEYAKTGEVPSAERAPAESVVTEGEPVAA